MKKKLNLSNQDLALYLNSTQLCSTKRNSDLKMQTNKFRGKIIPVKRYKFT